MNSGKFLYLLSKSFPNARRLSTVKSPCRDKSKLICGFFRYASISSMQKNKKDSNLTEQDGVQFTHFGYEKVAESIKSDKGLLCFLYILFSKSFHTTHIVLKVFSHYTYCSQSLFTLHIVLKVFSHYAYCFQSLFTLHIVLKVFSHYAYCSQSLFTLHIVL